MLQLLVVAVALLIFETLVWRCGADSRDGNDWTPAPYSAAEPVRALVR